MSEAINRSASIYLADDGGAYPITNWFADGDECEPDFATSCVAGSGDTWFSIDLSQFEGICLQ
jgi:hypothetical protein